jgi:hypothetical protein
MARTLAPGALERQLSEQLALIDQDLAFHSTRRATKRVPRRRGGAPRARRPRLLGAILTVVAASALAATAVVAYSDLGTLDVQVATRAGYAVDTTTAGAIVEYIGDQNTTFGSSGTGTFGTFVQIQDNPSEEGYNTDGVREFDTGSSPTFNHSVKLSAIPTVPCESLDGSATAAGLCWELFADINDSNANDPAAAHIQLTDLEVWFTDDQNITGYDQGGTGFGADADLAYDYSGNIQINDVNQGSGRGDLRYLIPLDGIDIPADCGFGSQSCATYFVLYTAWGDTNDGTYRSDSGFEEWKVKTYPVVSVSKTADTSFTRTFAWTIDKSVDPDSWDLFRGDTGTSQYTVAVTKDDGTDSDLAISGTITIDNPGAKLDAVINSAADITDELSDGTPVDIDCGSITFPYTIPHGDSLVCTYSAAPTDTSADENTASVTLAEGTVFTGSADVVWGDPTTKVNDTINVDDTYAGDLGSFSDDGSTTYERTFACDADEGTHENTATIVETDQSDSASVDVNCYALGVSKDADTSFTRTYEWTIDKSSEAPTELTLNPGEPYDYPYDVTVDLAGHTDSAFAATGNIHVTNPAPMSATLNSVDDVISGGITADVDCGVTFPYTLVAAGTLDCTYSADLVDDSAQTNTASATLQNYDYDFEDPPAASGTTDFSGTASVDFTGADVAEVDECIDVTDTYAGALGTVCVGDALPKTFSYTRTIQPTEEDCAGLVIDNTASFETNDTSTTGSDDWEVIVTVPCEQGCTLTQGYWKTHSIHGPAKKTDPTWDLVGGPDTTFFLSGKTWYEVFWTAPKGNAYYILAHQYEAAKLNILSGASSTTAVDNAIAWAENFFNTYTPTNWPKGLKNVIVQNAGILGSYNEGTTGPGHCDEDSLASAGNLSATSGTR